MFQIIRSVRWVKILTNVFLISNLIVSAILSFLTLNEIMCNKSEIIFIQSYRLLWQKLFSYSNSRNLLSLIKKKWFSESFKTLKNLKLTKLEKLLRQLLCLLWTIFFWTCCSIRSKFQWNSILSTDLRMLLSRVLLNNLWAFIQIFFWFSDIFRVRVTLSLD